MGPGVLVGGEQRQGRGDTSQIVGTLVNGVWVESIEGRFLNKKTQAGTSLCGELNLFLMV